MLSVRATGGNLPAHIIGTKSRCFPKSAPEQHSFDYDSLQLPPEDTRKRVVAKPDPESSGIA